jgi:hypothetical protein
MVAMRSYAKAKIQLRRLLLYPLSYGAAHGKAYIEFDAKTLG